MFCQPLFLHFFAGLKIEITWPVLWLFSEGAKDDLSIMILNGKWDNIKHVNH